MNITPGNYWAKWRSAVDGTRDAGELTPSDEWEVVRVCAGLGRPGEALFVLVPGVDKAQAPECFEWGGQVAAASGREASAIRYRNWRGEIAERQIIPLRVWHGATEWHPEAQLLLTAWDLDKCAERDFALADVLPPERMANDLPEAERARQSAERVLAISRRIRAEARPAKRKGRQ